MEEVLDHRLDVLVGPQRNLLHFHIVLPIGRFCLELKLNYQTGSDQSSNLGSSSLEEFPQFSNVPSDATCQILINIKVSRDE